MRLFYVDTNIWIDYFENRSDGLRPLGEWANQFFIQCKQFHAHIVVSDHVLNELSQFYTPQQLDLFFESFGKLIVNISTKNNQLVEAKNIERSFPESHHADILHAIIARDMNALVITRDKGFYSLSKIVRVARPEEISLD